MAAAKPLIASRFQVRRVESKDAPLGALVLFQPPKTERTPAPPNITFGIVADFAQAGQSEARRVIFWIGAAHELVSIDQVNVAAVFEGTPWQVVPNFHRAQYRSPEPGDLVISVSEGMGIVVAPETRGQAILSLKSATAIAWRADGGALAMPWRIVSGDDLIVPERPPTA